MDYVIIEGVRARAKLINAIAENNVVPRHLTQDAVDELIICMGVMSGIHRWNYAVSNKLQEIWKYAVLDTINYKSLCFYACHLYKKPHEIIPFSPENWGIGSLRSRQLKMYEKLNIYAPRLLIDELWQEIIYIPESDNKYIIELNCIRHQSFVIDIVKTKKVKDIVDIIAAKYQLTNNNIHLIYNGRILDINTVLNTILGINTNHVLTYVITNNVDLD